MQEQENLNDGQGFTREIGGVEQPTKVKAKWDPKGRRNMLIIGGVVGVAFLTMGIIIFGGGNAQDRESGKESSATQSNDAQPVANGMLSQDDRTQLKLQEDARITSAQRDGTSLVANPVPTSSVIIASGTLPPGEQMNTMPAAPAGGSVRMDSGSSAYVAQQSPPAAPSVDADKLQGMSEQMTQMMKAWGMSGDASTTSASYIRDGRAGNTQAQGNGSGTTAAGSAQRSPDDRMVIPAHEEAYAAETMGPIDTDTPGKLRARILSGPLTGAVVTGQARRIGTQGVQFDFTAGSFKGVPIKIVAYGVDMGTSGDVVEGNYHGRYLERFVFPVLAEGVKAYAGARAQVGTQVIAINLPGVPGGTTGAQQTPAPDAEQARAAMVSAGAGQVSTILKSGPQQGHITLDVRTPIGIVFEEAIYQSDLAGTVRRNAK